MGQLPIVSGSEVSTPMSTVKLDPAAFRQAALMKGKVAGALGDNIGGFFQQVSDNVQEARNARHVFDAHLTLNKTKDQFLSDIQTNPQLASDPKTWLPEYKQRMEQARQQIMDKDGLGPKVKRNLDMMTQNFAQQSTAEINTAALLRETADNKEAGILTATYAAQNGKEAEAIEIFKSLNRIGIDGPKVTAARIAQVPGIAAEANADTAINTNPITAPDVIQQFKDKINPKKYPGIESRAYEARYAAQSGYADKLGKMIDDNPDHTIEPKMLQGWRDAGKIDTQQYDRLNNRIKSYALAATKEKNAKAKELDKTETNEWNVAMMQVHDVNWTNDKTPQETAKNLKALGLGWQNAELRRKLNDYVDQQMKSAAKEGKSAERPVEKEIMDNLREDREYNDSMVPIAPEVEEASSGFLGIGKHPESVKYNPVPGGLNAIRKMSPDAIESTFGKGMTKEKVLAAEQLHYATIQGKMRDWFADPANKDADYEKANAYRQTLEKPYVMDSVKQSLLKDHPVAITSEEEFNQLPSGASFIYNGRVGTKK